MNHRDKKIVIIGGGPAGISAAKFALQNGFADVTILEGSETLGGLHRDVQIDGVHFDLGAFFFWNYHSLLILFPELKNILIYAESSKHLSLTKKLNIDKYPLTLKLYLEENGLSGFVLDIFRLLLYRFSKKESDCKNVDELMTYHMGPFYKKSGLENYIRRLYNMEPKNVAIEFATKRMAFVIDKFRFSKIFKALIQFDWKYLGHYQIVEDTWARPESGFATMYAYIQDQLKKDNCTVFLSQKVHKINAEKKIVETESGNIVGYDYFLSTQSIKATARMVDLPFDGELNHRLLCSLFFKIPEEAIEDCFVLFNFSDLGKWKRTTFHSNYYNRTHTNKNNLSHYFVVESMPDDSQIEDINMVELLRQDFVSSFSGTKWYSTFSKSKLI